MKTTAVSTQALSDALRLSLAKAQLKLINAEKEVSSGRHADVGATLGYKTTQTVSLRQEHARLQTIVDTNSIVSGRLEATQAALKDVLANAQTFMSTLVSARDAGSGPAAAKSQAEAGLTAFIDSLNNSFDGGQLFSGINADVKPIADYYANPPATNKVAVDAAFLTAFGVSQSDPGVAGITAGDMKTFLDTTFAGLFDDPAWTNDWSQSSTQNVRSRISTHELVETSVNANESGFRKLASAYAMIADLGVDKMNKNTFQAVVDTALNLVGNAIGELTTLQAKVGTTEQRVTNASERMSIQIDLMTKHISVLESVDPYEASTRVTALLTQIETAYALTARIQKLSVLNYL
jgi:flagellar hook-associated protein 3 FlgL